MRKLRLRKSMKAAWITAAMTLAGSSLAFGAGQALPNGTIVNVGGVNYLTDPQGERYSGWFIDAEENWYYFNESDKAMKTGWHHDSEDGYWYYLNPADGKMMDGWQTIDGKEYFFQPVRNMGNYYFGNEEEKWRYALNGNIPYGAMYINTTTLDGSVVDGNGAKISNKGSQNRENGWVQSGGNWYYFNPDGSLAVNCWINGTYYVGADGAMYVNRMTPDGVQVNGNGERVVNNTASSKVDYKGNHKFKGDEWIDIKNYYWKDNAIYLQGTYCDGIQNPNPEYEADRIHFIPVKENVTVIVNSNTKQSRSFVEFKEWLDGAMSWYGNAEVGVRLDGEYVTEIIDFMVRP